VFPLAGTTVPAGLAARIRRGEAAGVVVFARNVASTSAIRALAAQLQAIPQPQSVRAPLLLMVDQEGGQVKRLPGAPRLSPPEMAATGDPGTALAQGRATAATLRGAGMNVDLAPVVDVPRPGGALAGEGRGFGGTAREVARFGTQFARGLERGGVAATAKHFPGLGWATVSTDDHPVAVAATTAQLQADLLPFKTAIAAGVPMIMVSTASYPTLGAKKPAALSPTIVSSLLRGQLGFHGVVITDDLESPAVGNLPAAVAGRSALEAGDDLLLYAKSTKTSATVFGDLVKDVKSGQLNRSVVQAAYDRVKSLKESPTG
jgi:beta-N-acetylhexosaminidase